MAAPDSPSTSAAPAACQFPSVKTDAPLVDSYTFHSVDKEVAASAKGKEVEQPAIEGDWMLGVDEAGRGPVLGPQVYGIAFCQLEYSDELKSLGFADSKTLKDPEREELFEVIMEKEENVKYAVTVMSPHDISRGMLRRNPYNLNAQSHDVTINLIREVLERGYKIKEAYIDTVGIADTYQQRLEGLFPTVSFTVTSKADAIYPIVSAASIVAKVTRDRLLAAWNFLEKDVGKGDESRVFGSGYPSDPKTVAWLENNLEPVFGFPNVARFSWQPVKTALMKKGAKVKWDDEQASIQKYFSGEALGPQKAALWKDFALASVGAF
ncbi:ribonuclease [Leucosporidium creatinivorum]|uniref:Ribonuclease n=1 Tax=Leucosporidium creatinivorum TaxID=106004 RepID=A0A1Y2F2W5_9BASI|nr:ribonuclease [Leucosporidium creatinivorum]